ncbi:hypothetical protein [Rhizobium paknamense]|uniref:Uncharacterized protein n=1 Tax=Rhizobium paknamense TaxID=1206817 RepID=A0ABU0IC48_9HYPH|nr:hypothetical protein [Rhizobium paknamense]MDQ0455809.1 hypothetical protein [Rhizobium paknamense]
MGFKPDLYFFLMRIAAFRNRSLIRFGSKAVPVPTGEPDMSDLIFLALGCGGFIVLALYAGALDRL